MNWKQRAEAAEEAFAVLEAEQEVTLERLDELTDYWKSINSIISELAHTASRNRNRYRLVPEELAEALILLSEQCGMNIPWNQLLGRDESFRYSDNLRYDYRPGPFITNPNSSIKISGV